METKKQSLFAPQFVLGILIIVLGVIFMLDNFGYFDAAVIVRYWPAILVVYGAAKVVQSPGSPGRVFGVILIAVGSMMLLDKMDIIEFRLLDWWPVILIIIGMNFLRGSWSRSKVVSPAVPSGDGSDKESYIKNFVLMSGVKRTVSSKDFRGGELTAIMGGCEIDLRDAAIKENEAVLDIFTLMGGVELRVPMDWTVVVQSVPIMGGVEDKTYLQQEGKPTKRLVITGNVFMGGIEIKN